MAVFTWAVVIFFLGYAISLFTSNYKLITTGECINLDEYLEGSEDDDNYYFDNKINEKQQIILNNIKKMIKN